MRIHRWLLLVGFCLPLAGGAEVYKWVDADGVTHYSESSPENVPARQIELEPAPSAAETEAARQRLEQSKKDYENRRRLIEQSSRQRQARRRAAEAEQAIRREACGHALVQLRVLERARPVYRDEQGIYHWQQSAHSGGYTGKREYLDDAARAAEIARFTREVDTNCGDEERDEAWLEERLAAYHRAQCDTARELLVELRTAGLDSRADQRLRVVDRDIDRHCIDARITR